MPWWLRYGFHHSQHEIPFTWKIILTQNALATENHWSMTKLQRDFQKLNHGCVLCLLYFQWIILHELTANFYCLAPSIQMNGVGKTIESALNRSVVRSVMCHFGWNWKTIGTKILVWHIISGWNKLNNTNKSTSKWYLDLEWRNIGIFYLVFGGGANS